MTTTSASETGAKSQAGAKVRVQRFGTFISGMVMPNIAAFIAWGLITALFIPTGWLPLLGVNAEWVQLLGGWSEDPEVTNVGLVGPMITYLLPLLIANTGGRLVYGVRGGVVGTIATMGVIIGAGIPMFLGAMIVGPGAAWVMKQIDKLWANKVRAGFEMLIDNFSGGIVGAILAVFSFFLIAPAVTAISNALESVVNFLVSTQLLPLASVFVEPGKVLFLNNAINHGVFTPLGTVEAQRTGQSILFLIEANPGPGLGILVAFAVFGVGILKASAPGAVLIQFVGGIHEIYFPYILAKPLLILAAIAGGATGVLTNVVFGSGLRAPASPGSIIAVLAQTPPGSFVGVILSVVLSASVSFFVAAVIIRASRSRDLEAVAAGDNALADAVAKNAGNKGRDSQVAGLLGQSGGSAVAGDSATGGTTTGGTVTESRVESIVFACDAGMGSSAMGATVLRNKIKKAGIDDVTVVNQAIANLDGSADLVITQRELTPRAQEKSPNSRHVSVDNFMGSPAYDEVVALVQEQHGK